MEVWVLNFVQGVCEFQLEWLTSTGGVKLSHGITQCYERHRGSVGKRNGQKPAAIAKDR